MRHHSLMIIRRSLNKKIIMNLSPREDHNVKEEVSFLMTVVYMSDDVNNIGKMDDPASYKEAMKSKNSLKGCDAIEEELRSMISNDVYDLVEILDGAKRVSCKWDYKMKYDSKGKIKRFKARLVAKGFTQREGIDYTETFSPMSEKDSFRIVMTLVSHYDLELHQMDVKTVFLNGDLQEVCIWLNQKVLPQKARNI
jgi:hypothetical protein